MEKIQRNQGLRVRTGKKKTYIGIASVIILLVVGAVLFFIGWRLKQYKPLEYEANAQKGKPVVEEGFLYTEVQTDFGYAFGMAANLYQQEDGTLLVYFVNPEDSEAYLMCSIEDKKTDKVLYESGLVKPGEYVERLEPASHFANVDKDISVTIYAFEPDTFYSLGTTHLSSILHKW